MTDYTYDDEWELYKRMGWCCCPECDTIFYDWQQFKQHADECVYGEQGINMRRHSFDWSVNS